MLLALYKYRNKFPFTFTWIINHVQFVYFEELFTDRPAVAAPAVVPGSQCSQSREPAMLRTTPVPPRTPTGTPDLEPPASSSGPAGGLTFHLPYIHNTARDGTSHRVSSSQLCAEWRHTLAQTGLAAPVLGLLMTEGHLCFCSVDFLLCFLFSPHFFKRWDFSVMNSGPVLYLIYLIFAKKKTKKSFYCSNISAFGGTREGQWVLFILMCQQQNGMKWWGNIWASF